MFDFLLNFFLHFFFDNFYERYKFYTDSYVISSSAFLFVNMNKHLDVLFKLYMRIVCSQLNNCNDDATYLVKVPSSQTLSQTPALFGLDL